MRFLNTLVSYLIVFLEVSYPRPTYPKPIQNKFSSIKAYLSMDTSQFRDTENPASEEEIDSDTPSSKRKQAMTTQRSNDCYRVVIFN